MSSFEILMFLIVLLLLASVFFVWVYIKKPTTPNLQPSRRLLSPLENLLFKRLESALQDDFYVFSKVAMSKVLEVAQNAGPIDRLRMQHYINEEYFDFVLCAKHDLSIFGVVCIHRSSKNAKTKKAHDERCKKIEEACAAACLRVIHFDLDHSYQDVDLLNMITGRSKQNNQDASVSVNERTASQHTSHSRYTVADNEYSVSAAKRCCPICDSPLVTKVAKNGKLKGQKFILCSDYPKCEYKISRIQDLKMRRIAS